MPTRRLMTTALYNARDLGGFPTRDGKTTKFGVFVRSEAPCELPDSDIAYLLDYGVTASIDLRSTGEAQSRPNELQGHMAFYHKPLFNEAAMGKGPGEPPPGGPGGPGGAPGFPAWGETYKQMVEEARDWAKEVLTIAAENEGAVLYHCTTGKDRTGVMTCYLLSIAGVSREDIAADYCVSQVYLEPVFEKMRSGNMKMGPLPENTDGAHEGPGGPRMDDGFFQTPASAMLTLIDYLTERYGGDESKKDKHEADPDYLRRCREAALYAAGNDPYAKWTVLGCCHGGKLRSAESIHAEIAGLIEGLGA